ncbi:MAG TPA: glycosyltransferase family 4 protein [Dysgonamonadaceae bacterium]|nr:glycosyltransferase family 4 protein [Dysgonamonadaceae bacterium]
MNVLIVSTHDQQGGAAIAAYRLLEALNRNGVAASMLTLNKESDNVSVVEVGNSLFNKYRFAAERATIYIQNGFSRKNLFDISIANTGVSITNHPEFKKADIVHLHWVNQGMLSVREIGKIVASGKKIVWTMHDMWPFTGICHHAKECKRFETGCGLCPYLNNPSKGDISYSTYLRKQAAYSLGKIHFVACSNWLKELALKSKLTINHNVSAIANPINTETYKPKDKATLRQAMKLPINKKIILFAAAKVSDKRKGIDYLIEASKIIAQQEHNNCMFIIAGGNSKEIINQLALPTVSVGYVASSEMPNLYNAVDLFVTPSLQENLPNTIMESMACGTPCVGFNIGGIPEMIDHKQNGYVANYRDAQDLANGLMWVLESTETLAKNAHNKVMKQYSEEIIAKRYIEIYNKK